MIETRNSLPLELEEMPPGPELGEILATVECSRLSGHDRVILMKAWHRQLAYVQAGFLASSVSVLEALEEEAELPVQEAAEAAEYELRAALSWTRRAAERHLDLAWRVVKRLPLVWQAMRDGLIDLPKARVIVDNTDHLDERGAREVAAVALRDSSQLTTGQLAAWLRKLAIAVDPDGAENRYQSGLAERRVVTVPNEDGTANLYGLCFPADRTAAAMNLINELARAAKTADDTRTIDQVRADVLIDLLEGRHHRHRSRRGVVDLRVDLVTLAGLSDEPGEIPGWGPVISDICRRIADDKAEWRVTVTDDDDSVVWDGTTQRRPTIGQRRHVEARNHTCVFPGCRMPAAMSDLDHMHEWSRGGPTEVGNLAPACRHDHNAKTKYRWTLGRDPSGVHTWTSLLGHAYTTRPPP